MVGCVRDAPLAGLLDRGDEADHRRRRQLATARTSRTEAEKAIGNPPRLVENKTRPADRREMVERIAFQRARQQSPATEIESTERQPTVSRKRITPEVIAEVGQVARARLVAGDPNFRRSCVAPLVKRATVPAEQIRLTGTRSAIRHLLVSDKPPLAGPVPISDGIGAVEKTRTSTAFRPQRPQRCASTSSATTARDELPPVARWLAGLRP